MVEFVVDFGEAFVEFGEDSLGEEGGVETPHNHRLPEARESYTWKETGEILNQKLEIAMQNVVKLCDREAGIYRLLDYKKTGQGVGVVGY